MEGKEILAQCIVPLNEKGNSEITIQNPKMKKMGNRSNSFKFRLDQGVLISIIISMIINILHIDLAIIDIHLAKSSKLL